MIDAKEKIKKFPNSPGVYLFRAGDGSVLYIGKARVLKKRVSSYFNKTLKDPRIESMVSQIADVDFIELKSEEEAFLVEDKLVKEYQPRYNIDLKDDKRYPLIKLTTNEPYPQLLIVRQKKNDGSKYYGPYTDARALRNVVKFLRKTFKLRRCKAGMPSEKDKEHCLYFHIGECLAPCVNKVSHILYGETVKQVCLLLDGRGDELLTILKSKMLYMSRHKNYEKAAEIRDLIRDVEQILGSKVRKDILKGMVYKPADVKREVEELGKVLGMEKLPVWIDAFDVSNLMGENAVGSLIVFRNGLPYKNGYRRFKIKTVAGISDYDMIAEIVERRYRRILNEGKGLPDLILIDGGLGQYNAAKSVLEAFGLGGIKVIGLAKRFEEIYSPELIKLPQDSPALKLLMRVRDEAHRFAIKYHRVLRRKRVFGKE